MRNAGSKAVHLGCPSCGGAEFEIRVLKDEGLAAARCIECNRDYLLLDSEDHWFDVIQNGYPRLSRCTCKATSFRLRCDYFYRPDGDVSSINLWSTCSNCQKVRCQMTVDIDYGDTQNLVIRPLRYCKNPRVLYDLKQISLYVLRSDLARLIHFLAVERKCGFVAWLREQDKWVKHELNAEKVQEVILSDDGPLKAERYLRIYAMPSPIAVPDRDVDTIPKEAAFWKRQEVINISPPTHMGWGAEKGLLFYINLSNEYVHEEAVIQKSARFRELTKSLLDWLQVQFVSWRGPLCFDNPAENIRIFGNRFVPRQDAESGR